MKFFCEAKCFFSIVVDTLYVTFIGANVLNNSLSFRPPIARSAAHFLDGARSFCGWCSSFSGWCTLLTLHFSHWRSMLAPSSSRTSGSNSGTQQALSFTKLLAILFDSRAVKWRVWVIEANVVLLVFACCRKSNWVWNPETSDCKRLVKTSKVFLRGLVLYPRWQIRCCEAVLQS